MLYKFTIKNGLISYLYTIEDGYECIVDGELYCGKDGVTVFGSLSSLKRSIRHYLNRQVSWSLYSNYNDKPPKEILDEIMNTHFGTDPSKRMYARKICSNIK